MNSAEFKLLAIGTILFLAVSWNMSVKAGRYHGIYRFFSFESILILVLLNWRYWFVSAFEGPQLISWAFLVGSIALAVAGFYLLRAVGKPDGQIENTTKLVKVGIYRYIRHPLYASLILLGLGVFLKHPTWIAAFATLLNLVALFATAAEEEKEMTKKFGAEYRFYMQTTKKLIPYIF